MLKKISNNLNKTYLKLKTLKEEFITKNYYQYKQNIKTYLFANHIIIYMIIFNVSFFYHFIYILKLLYIFIYINLIYFFKWKINNKVINIPDFILTSWSLDKKITEFRKKIKNKETNSLNIIEFFIIIFKKEKRFYLEESLYKINIFNIFWIFKLLKTALILNKLNKINLRKKKEVDKLKSELKNKIKQESSTTDSWNFFTEKNENLFSSLSKIIETPDEEIFNSSLLFHTDKKNEKYHIKNLYLESLEKELSYLTIYENKSFLILAKILNFFWLLELNYTNENIKNFIEKLKYILNYEEKRFLLKFWKTLINLEKEYGDYAIYWEFDGVVSLLKKAIISHRISFEYFSFLNENFNINEYPKTNFIKLLDTISKDIDNPEKNEFFLFFKSYVNTFFYIQHIFFLLSYKDFWVFNQECYLHYKKLKSIFNKELYFNLNSLNNKNYNFKSVIKNKLQKNKLFWLTKKQLNLEKFELIINELFIKNKTSTWEIEYKLKKEISNLDCFIIEPDLLEEIENIIFLTKWEEEEKALPDTLISYKDFELKKSKILIELRKCIFKHNYKILNNQTFKITYFILNTLKVESSIISEKELKNIFNSNQKLFHIIYKTININNNKDNHTPIVKATVFINRICKFSTFLKQNFNTYKIFKTKEDKNSGKLLNLFFHLLRLIITDKFYHIFRFQEEIKRSLSTPKDVTKFYLKKEFWFFLLKRALDFIWDISDNFSQLTYLSNYNVEKALKTYINNPHSNSKINLKDDYLDSIGEHQIDFTDLEFANFEFELLNSFNIREIFYNKNENRPLCYIKERNIIIEKLKKILIKLKLEDFFKINEEYHYIQINKDFLKDDIELNEKLKINLNINPSDLFNSEEYDYNIEQLSTHNTLILEGKIMGHCVGWYWDRVNNWESVIFSLEKKEKILNVNFLNYSEALKEINENWFSLKLLKDYSKNRFNKSTIEFTKQNNYYQIIQNRAPFNETPSEDLEALWIKLKELLNKN